MKILIFAMVLCILGITGIRAQKPVNPTEFFPLSPGTYWVYKGTVRWHGDENDKPAGADVTWKMTVERMIRRPGVVGVVVSGFPADLDWAAGTTEPKPWLILEDDKHRIFYENLGPDFDLAKLNGDDHSFDKFMVDDNFFFQWPLRQGAKFCDEDAKKREDDNYCWVAAELSKKKLQGVAGAPAENQPVIRMEYRTIPDDQKVELVQGVGIVSYHYHHHGTVADTELQLVEFHRAPGNADVQGSKP